MKQFFFNDTKLHSNLMFDNNTKKKLFDNKNWCHTCFYTAAMTNNLNCKVGNGSLDWIK